MGDCPAASQRRDAGEQREGGRNMLSGDDQQPSETQNEVYQVGDKEAEEISAHSKTGKQKIEKKTSKAEVRILYRTQIFC